LTTRVELVSWPPRTATGPPPPLWLDYGGALADVDELTPSLLTIRRGDTALRAGTRPGAVGADGRGGLAQWGRPRAGLLVRAGQPDGPLIGPRRLRRPAGLSLVGNSTTCSPGVARPGLTATLYGPTSIQVLFGPCILSRTPSAFCSSLLYAPTTRSPCLLLSCVVLPLSVRLSGRIFPTLSVGDPSRFSRSATRPVCVLMRLGTPADLVAVHRLGPATSSVNSTAGGEQHPDHVTAVTVRFGRAISFHHSSRPNPLSGGVRQNVGVQEPRSKRDVTDVTVDTGGALALPPRCIESPPSVRRSMSPPLALPPDRVCSPPVYFHSRAVHPHTYRRIGRE